MSSSPRSTVLSDDREVSPQEPQRLSALYQYHNAPEVAPAHGLEYDDNVYPLSDKYPVIREAASYDTSNYTGKHAFANDNRPPRIIFGMKVRTFLMVALVMILVIVGAAVGGAVGGHSIRETQAVSSGDYLGSYTNASATTTSTVPTSLFTAPTPTYSPLADCQNATIYTSAYLTGTSGSVPPNAGLNFMVYCNVTNPLSSKGSSKIAEAYTYSLSDCIEVCAGYNFWNKGDNCTVAAYDPTGSRPGNCWVGTAGGNKVDLKDESGLDVAVLQGPS